MNMQFDIKSLGKLLGKKKAGSTDRAVGHPSRDFAILIGILLLCITGSLAYHVYLFLGTNTEDGSAAVDAGTITPAVNAGVMQATLSALEAKRARFETLKVSPPSVPEPAR